MTADQVIEDLVQIGIATRPGTGHAEVLREARPRGSRTRTYLRMAAALALDALGASGSADARRKAIRAALGISLIVPGDDQQLFLLLEAYANQGTVGWQLVLAICVCCLAALP
jgi:hypothetical protein